MKILIEFDENKMADSTLTGENQLDEKEFLKLRNTRDFFHEMAREFWHGLFREIAVMYCDSQNKRCSRRYSEAFGVKFTGEGTDPPEFENGTNGKVRSEANLDSEKSSAT